MDLDFKPRDPRDPDMTWPRFHLRAEQNNFQTAQQGRPIYDEVEFVEIITPGQNRSTPVEMVTDEHRTRWPAQYKAFKDGLEIAIDGTPLEQWPVTTPAMVLNLKHFNIRTVEQLAQLDDHGLQNIGMGGRELRQRAQDYLAAAESMAPIERERARAEAAESEVVLLKAQLTDLGSRLAQLEKAHERASV